MDIAYNTSKSWLIPVLFSTFTYVILLSILHFFEYSITISCPVDPIIIHHIEH